MAMALTKEQTVARGKIESIRNGEVQVSAQQTKSQGKMEAIIVIIIHKDTVVNP